MFVVTAIGKWNRAAVYYGEQYEKTDIEYTDCSRDGYDDIFLQGCQEQ